MKQKIKQVILSYFANDCEPVNVMVESIFNLLPKPRYPDKDGWPENISFDKDENGYIKTTGYLFAIKLINETVVYQFGCWNGNNFIYGHAYELNNNSIVWYIPMSEILGLVEGSNG